MADISAKRHLLGTEKKAVCRNFGRIHFLHIEQECAILFSVLLLVIGTS